MPIYIFKCEDCGSITKVETKHSELHNHAIRCNCGELMFRQDINKEEETHDTTRH